EDDVLGGTGMYNLYAVKSGQASNGRARARVRRGSREMNGHKVTAEGLKGFLRGKVPDYMRPAQIVLLDELPLTANGKIDRQRLPEPEVTARDVEQESRTPIEEMLAGIWKEVLGLNAVGSSESFFDIGGHSLLATQVVSRAREVFGVEIELRRMFEEPTIAGLARAVEEG